MEAYVEEVRKLDEHFDGFQTGHMLRVENNIVGHLQNAPRKNSVWNHELLSLHLTQTSVSPSMMARKRRKLDSGKYL